MGIKIISKYHEKIVSVDSLVNMTRNDFEICYYLTDRRQFFETVKLGMGIDRWRLSGDFFSQNIVMWMTFIKYWLDNFENIIKHFRVDQHVP
jgi:hypothetical protein